MSRGYVHREGGSGEGGGECCCSGMGIFHDASGQRRPLVGSRGSTGSCKGDAPRCARPPLPSQVPMSSLEVINFSF